MRTRQLLLSNLPRRRRGWTAFENWQRAASQEEALLDQFDEDGYYIGPDDGGYDFDPGLYDDALQAAHAATEEAFKPLAPLVKTWWTVPHGH